MKEILEMKRVHNRMEAKRKTREEKERLAREAALPPQPVTPGKLQSANLIDLNSPVEKNNVEKKNNLINLNM